MPVLELQQTAEGVRALNDPDSFEISRDLIAQADPALMSVVDDLVTLHLVDGDRRYRVVDGTEHAVRVEKESS